MVSRLSFIQPPDSLKRPALLLATLLASAGFLFSTLGVIQAAPGATEGWAAPRAGGRGPTAAPPAAQGGPQLPAIALTKTVGLDPAQCAATDSVTVPAGGGGTMVTYCYTVANSGNVTFTVHDLVDDPLGVLQSGTSLVLAPGDSAFVTATTNITQTTINTGTWTAGTGGGVIADPAGDTFGQLALQHDVITFSAGRLDSVLVFQLVFSGTISPADSGLPNALVGAIDIDADQNSGTGGLGVADTFCPNPPGLGIEYGVDMFSYNSGTGTMPIVDQNGTPVGNANATFQPNAVTIFVPLSLIGGDEGFVDTAAVAGTVDEPTDCAPDGQSLASSVAVSASDTATVTQDAPTDVNLTSLVADNPPTLLPAWLGGLLLLGSLGLAGLRKVKR